MIAKTVTALSGISRLKGSLNLFDKFDVSILEKDLIQLPKDGRFITISNRPFGLIDEIVLIKVFRLIGQQTHFLDNAPLRELKIMDTEFSANLDNDVLFDFNTTNSPLSLFPVGNISDYQTPYDSFTDSKWDKYLIKKLYDCEVPVVPIYLQGLNSKWVKAMGMMHPALKTRTIVNELLSNEKFEAKVRIGKAIKANEIGNFYNANHFGRYLRAKVYTLGTALSIEEFYVQNPSKPIEEATDIDQLLREIDHIRDSNYIGSQLNFEVFLCKAKKIPLLIREIGRLREETFRDVGEGTNESLDLDEYDLNYLHLFVWDKAENRLVGAYRIGDGSYIMKTYGKKGFYLRSLFKISDEMDQVLERSFELGRSFIVKEYQKQRLPLHLLWKGIAYFIANNNHLKYIIGPVSVSNNYSKVSQCLLVRYIRKYHWNETLAKMIKPKKEFNPYLEEELSEPLLDAVSMEIKKLDALIQDIEPMGLKIPVLLKKYFKQNAQILAFNIDPKFNNALDGFMITKIKDLPKETLDTFEN